MLERKDIKNGQLVFREDEGTYHHIKDVGNARSKGDRGYSTTPDDELSYTIVDVLYNKEDKGICEHSGMTSTFLKTATKRDVELYLAGLEADELTALGVAKKNLNHTQLAIERFSKFGENE